MHCPEGSGRQEQGRLQRRGNVRVWSSMSLTTRHLDPPPSSLPLMSGCSGCKSGSPAGNRCHGGHEGSGQGHLGAIAKEGKKGKNDKANYGADATLLQSNGHSQACPSSTKRSHLSFPSSNGCLKLGLVLQYPPMPHTSSCRRDLKGKILMGPGRPGPGTWTS